LKISATKRCFSEPQIVCFTSAGVIDCFLSEYKTFAGITVFHQFFITTRSIEKQLKISVFGSKHLTLFLRNFLCKKMLAKSNISMLNNFLEKFAD